MSEPARVAGRLEIPVESDLSGFAQALKTRVEAIANSVKAKVGVEWEDTSTLRARLETAVEAAAKGVTAKVKTKIDVDKAQAERAARVAAQAVTKVVEREGAQVKVEADDRVTRQTTGILARLKAWAKAQSVEIPFTMGSPRGPTGRGPFPGAIGMALRAPMILGLLSLIQPAIALIMQSLGGLTAMLGSAIASLNTLASVAPLINALGFSFAAGLIAFTGWNEEAENTTKSMQAIRREVQGLAPEWGRLLQSVREATWSQVAGEIEPLATHLLPLLNDGLTRIGETMGTVMRDGLRFMDTPRFASNLRSMLETSDEVIDGLLRGFGGLLVFWTDLSVAAGPFTEGMANTFREFGEWTATLLDGRGERAEFRDWLQYAGEKATELGRIIRNLWTGFGGLFDGGRESGDRLMATLERVTERWSNWTNSLAGQNELAQWFAVAEEGTYAVGNLLSALWDSIMRLANDDTLATIVNRITGELLPALESFLQQLGTELGPVVIDFISNVLELLSQLATAGGPIAAVLTSFNDLIVMFNELLEVTPGLASALGLLAGAVIVMRPLSLIFAAIAGGLGKLSAASGAGKFAGLLGLVGILTGLTGAAEGAHPVLSTLAGTLGAMLLLGPRARAFGASLTNMFVSMRDARRRASDMAALQRGLANISGSYAGIDLATGAIRRTGDAAGRAAPRFGALRVAAGGLKTAAGGLLGVLGGPWGIALGVAVTGLTMWWQKNQDAKAAVDQHTQAILDNAGALGEKNREMVASALMDEGAFEAADRLGIAYKDLVNAAMGDVPEASARVAAASAKAKEQFDREAEAARGVRGGYTLISDGAKQAAADARLVTGAVSGQNEVVGEAVGKAEAKAIADEAAADAAREAGDGNREAAEGTAEYAAQQDAALRTVNTLREGIEGLLDTMREQREMTMSAREAVRAQKDEYDRAVEGVARLKEELGSLDGALTKNRDGFNTNSEAGRELEESFDGIIEATWRALESNAEAGASQEDLNKIWQRGKDDLAAFGAEVGLTPEGLKALAAELGMTEAEFALFSRSVEDVPETVETDVKVKGTEKGKTDLAGLKAAAEANPKDVTTNVSVPGAATSTGLVAGLEVGLGKLPGSKKTDVSAPGTTNSTGIVQTLKSWYDRLPGFKRTDVSAPGTTSSTGLIQFLIDTANRIPGSKSTNVTANTGSAWSNLAGILNQLWNIRDKSVTVTTYHRTLKTAVANGAVFNAEGGVQHFDNGGMSTGRAPFWQEKIEKRLRNGFRNVEQHVAQILPAGAWRVWAEDETGGEAYIPLSPGKRPRSMAILREVAARFGMSLMPAAAMFGGGGMSMPAARNTGGGGSPARFTPPPAPTYVTFEEGAIQVTNPAPEPLSKTVAESTRSITLNGPFGED